MTGLRLKQLRMFTFKMTRENLAKKLEVHEDTIGKLERCNDKQIKKLYSLAVKQLIVECKL